MLVGSSKGRVQWQFSFRAVIWVIWKERNLRSFEGSFPLWTLEGMIEKVCFLITSWAAAFPIFHDISFASIMRSWHDIEGLFVTCIIVLGAQVLFVIMII